MFRKRMKLLKKENAFEILSVFEFCVRIMLENFMSFLDLLFWLRRTDTEFSVIDVFELMKLFVSSPGRVFSRASLLEHLRGQDGYEVSERAVDVQILNLRRKFGDFGENIKTVRGAGYKLKESVGDE